MDQTPGTIRISSSTGRWLLLTAVLGSSMALLDSTVVNVALPHIGDDFGASLGQLQWTSNAYLLTLAAFILLGGALSDRSDHTARACLQRLLMGHHMTHGAAT